MYSITRMILSMTLLVNYDSYFKFHLLLWSLALPNIQGVDFGLSGSGPTQDTCILALVSILIFMWDADGDDSNLRSSQSMWETLELAASSWLHDPAWLL